MYIFYRTLHLNKTTVYIISLFLICSNFLTTASTKEVGLRKTATAVVRK